jgi:hypothetical protein
MLCNFDRELSLTVDQKKHFEAVFRDRQEVIEAYHRELRASKVFVPREYDRRIAEIQTLHYDRAGSVLNAEQYRKFVKMLSEKAQGDSIGFPIEADMVIVE